MRAFLSSSTLSLPPDQRQIYKIFDNLYPLVLNYNKSDLSLLKLKIDLNLMITDSFTASS